MGVTKRYVYDPKWTVKISHKSKQIYTTILMGFEWLRVSSIQILQFVEIGTIFPVLRSRDQDTPEFIGRNRTRNGELGCAFRPRMFIPLRFPSPPESMRISHENRGRLELMINSESSVSRLDGKTPNQNSGAFTVRGVPFWPRILAGTLRLIFRNFDRNVPHKFRELLCAVLGTSEQSVESTHYAW